MKILIKSRTSLSGSVSRMSPSILPVIDKTCTGIFIMDKICGVYKITSPNNRVYIGQSINIRKRFSDYKCIKCKDQSRLYNSLRKYGVDKHKFEILHQCEPEKLNELEVYYIELFQCFNNEYGLNLKSGGDSQYNISDETRLKMSLANIGKKHSEESKRKMSESKKGIPAHNKGVSMTDEQKVKVSLAKKGTQAWNKGMKGKYKASQATKDKMSITHKYKTLNRGYTKGYMWVNDGNESTLIPAYLDIPINYKLGRIKNGK